MHAKRGEAVFQMKSRGFGTRRVDTHIRPVHHAELNFVCTHGRFLGETDVTPDEVVAVDTLEGRTLYFQATGRGVLRFYELRKDGREHVAAHGVPSRLLKDFASPAEQDAAARLGRIKERRACPTNR